VFIPLTVITVFPGSGYRKHYANRAGWRKAMQDKRLEVGQYRKKPDPEMTIAQGKSFNVTDL
jgi:hypothetical protein